jgi:hypothetical protein
VSDYEDQQRRVVLGAFERALVPVTATEISNARHSCRQKGRRCTAENLANAVLAARRDNYSVYWRTP